MAHGLLQTGLQIQQFGCCLLAGLHPGLVVGVHVHQLAIEADGPLEQRDQRAEAGGIKPLQRDAQVEAPFLGEGGTGALQEAIEEIAGVLALKRRNIAGILEHLDEGHEEIVDTITQLLHIGVLIGGALVAINGKTLVHHLAGTIELLAEALHHQLLQVAAEHLQAIPVGEHHHVAPPLAATGHVPGRRQQGSGIALQLSHARGGVHGAGAGQEGAHVAADQHTGQQPHGAGDAGATTHPVEHVETGQPAALFSFLIQAAAHHGDRHGLTAPAAAVGLHRKPRLQHADVGLGGPPRLAHHDHQGGAQPLAEGSQRAPHAIGIDIVEEMEGQPGAGILQGADHQQGAQP